MFQMLSRAPQHFVLVHIALASAKNGIGGRIQEFRHDDNEEVLSYIVSGDEAYEQPESLKSATSADKKLYGSESYEETSSDKTVALVLMTNLFTGSSSFCLLAVEVYKTYYLEKGQFLFPTLQVFKS